MLGNEKVLPPILLHLQPEIKQEYDGFHQPHQAGSVLVSPCIEGARRKASFDIQGALSRHHLSVGELGQTRFTAGHWGQQSSPTICV